MKPKEILRLFRNAIAYQEEWAGSLRGAPDGEYEEFMKNVEKAKEAYKELRQVFKEAKVI